MDGGSSEARKHEAPTYERQDHRAPKRCRGDYDAEADEDDVRTEVTTGDGKTHKNTLPAKSTVLVLKQRLAHDAGYKPGQTRMFVNDDSREEELEEEEGLGSLRRGKGLAVLITMMVEEADAQEVVPRLAAKADLVLGDDTTGNDDDQLKKPAGVAFVPAHPDWVVTTELSGCRIKISNIRTGAHICKFGNRRGSGEGQFDCPYRVAVTSDSSFVIVADRSNSRVKVLRLVVAADGSSAHLEFVRHIGKRSGEGQLSYPTGVALLPGEGGGQETVLANDSDNHSVSQFKLDGTFIRIFAGTGKWGSDDGEFKRPNGITVLGSSGEVAVADFDNHRVQIFDSEGKYKRQFGSKGKEVDGQFNGPSALASDVHGNLLVLDFTNRLQVFSPKGKHLCTRNDMGLKASSGKGIAWSDVGELAIANGNGNQALVWRKE
jgi:tripartite motif-containing protein 2/3